MEKVVESHGEKHIYTGGKIVRTIQKPWPCLKCMVMMNKIDEDHCKCPICGTEVWHNYNSKAEDDESDAWEDIEDLMKSSIPCKQNPEFSILNGPPAPGGGSKTKGNSNKKQLLQKPSTTELYNRLNGTKASARRGRGRPKKEIDKPDLPEL